MGDHLGNQKQIREAMVVRPGHSGQYYGAVVAGLLQLVSKPGPDQWCQRGRWIPKGGGLCHPTSVGKEN